MTRAHKPQIPAGSQTCRCQGDRAVEEHQAVAVGGEIDRRLEIGVEDRQAGIDRMAAAMHDGRAREHLADHAQQAEIERHLVGHPQRRRRKAAQHSQVVVGQPAHHLRPCVSAKDADTGAIAVMPETQLAAGCDVRMARQSAATPRCQVPPTPSGRTSRLRWPMRTSVREHFTFPAAWTRSPAHSWERLPMAISTSSPKRRSPPACRSWALDWQVLA